ncbi:MAG: formylglycine-generating enzyme family protein [Deltaproteobacteria bacterium]|nr:formylglycine-generating enzyme family protein [Deltaproteobacteria bacterium]
MKKYLLIPFIGYIIVLFGFPHYTYAQDFKNSVGMSMVFIKGGKFTMGDQNNKGASDENPAHRVDVPSFFLSDMVVTSAQWEEFYYDGDTEWDKWEDVKKYSPEKDYPIIFVSWQDAVEFCRWLSEKEGKKYRLPTEAEWEYAARGSLAGKLYPWGDSAPDGSQCNFADKREYLKEKDIWAAGLKIDDGYTYCAKAKDYSPNKYGLYQMAGNVLQWCSDWYCSVYYKDTKVKNPQGPATGKLKALRGGAWCFPALMLRSSSRFGLSPNMQKEFIGFRVAMDIDKE